MTTDPPAAPMPRKIHIPPVEVLRASVEKYNRRIQGLDPDPHEPPPVPRWERCSHGNPFGNCFDCEE